MHSAIDALHETHRTLFVIYDLHVGAPHLPRGSNQFDPFVAEIRSRIEPVWIATVVRNGAVPAAGISRELLIAPTPSVLYSFPMALRIKAASSSSIALPRISNAYSTGTGNSTRRRPLIPREDDWFARSGVGSSSFL